METEAAARSRRRRTMSTSRKATQRQRRYTLEGELVLVFAEQIVHFALWTVPYLLADFKEQLGAL